MLIPYLVVLMLPGAVAGRCAWACQIDGGGRRVPASTAPVESGWLPVCNLLTIGPPGEIGGPIASTGAGGGAGPATGGATGAGGRLVTVGITNGAGAGAGSGSAVQPGVSPQW